MEEGRGRDDMNETLKIIRGVARVDCRKHFPILGVNKKRGDRFWMREKRLKGFEGDLHHPERAKGLEFSA